MRKIALAILTICLLWVSGFAYYIYLINSYKTNNTITNAIIVFAGGGRRVETAIALLKAGYAPILFITGISSQDQLRNLLKEQEIRDEQVIYAPNNIMSEEDYAKKTVDFIIANNLTSVRLVTSAYNMPVALRELTAAIPQTRQVYVTPHPTASIPGQYKILLKSYNQYLMSFFNFARRCCMDREINKNPSWRSHKVAPRHDDSGNHTTTLLCSFGYNN